MKDLLSVVNEHGHHLIAVRLFICARMNRAVIKVQDLRTRQTQKDRRMRNYHKLGPFFHTPVNLHQQCQLPLRRKRCFRFIQKIHPICPKAVLCERQKTFPMGFLMEVLWSPTWSPAVFFFLGSYVVKALRPQEISIIGAANSPG